MAHFLIALLITALIIVVIGCFAYATHLMINGWTPPARVFPKVKIDTNMPVQKYRAMLFAGDPNCMENLYFQIGYIDVEANDPSQLEGILAYHFQSNRHVGNAGPDLRVKYVELNAENKNWKPNSSICEQGTYTI